MPSLKDLRNRISSVKATQKITRPCRWWRRRSCAARRKPPRPRPYSQRMGAVLANVASTLGDADDAPKLMVGTGGDSTLLLVVCTAERGLCGGFNSSIAKLAKEHARKLLAEGKTVKILTVGKKGYDILRRDYGSNIIDRVDLRDVKRLAFPDADEIGKKVIELFEKGEFDVCTLYYSEFKSVISQIPTAQQLIPATAGGEAKTPGTRRRCRL
jgi:F-type H+-transporting ATPase subunit gamma